MAITREERFAAGWQRYWGVFDYEDNTWLCADGKTWSNVPRTRWWGVVYSVAKVECGRFGLDRAATPRPFWRRLRKVKPALFQVGDVVTMRGTIVRTDSPIWSPSVLVDFDGMKFWMLPNSIVKVERP